MPDVSDFNRRSVSAPLSMFRERIKREKASGITYAKLADIYAVNRFYLWSIINKPDYTPPLKVMNSIGIAPTAMVVVIGGGEIPEGAQVISANMCECGQPFISNHPARKRCFICSPFKKHIK